MAPGQPIDLRELKWDWLEKLAAGVNPSTATKTLENIREQLIQYAKDYNVPKLAVLAKKLSYDALIMLQAFGFSWYILLRILTGTPPDADSDQWAFKMIGNEPPELHEGQHRISMN